MSFVLYVPGNKKEIDVFQSIFENETHQTGFGYIGRPYQRGAGSLGNIFKGLLRKISPMAKSALKSIGKTAIKTAVGVASDVIKGENVIQSFKNRGQEAGKALFDEAAEHASEVSPLIKKLNNKRKAKSLARSFKKQKGAGLGNRPRRMKKTGPWATNSIKARPKGDIFKI